MLLWSTWLVVVALSATGSNGLAHPAPSKFKPTVLVEVCQNKHCCRNFEDKGASLYQVANDIVGGSSHVNVRSAECLSECDRGPNVVISNSGKESVVHGARDVFALALEFEAHGIEVEKKFITASSVLEQAHKCKCSLFWIGCIL